MTAAEVETPWMRLARISKDHEENIQLWNGYQKYLLRPHTDEYQRQMENPKFADIVDLSDAEIHSIQTKIPDLPKELSGLAEELRDLSIVSDEPGAIALTEGIAEIKTFPELNGYYFAFCVVIAHTRFKSPLFLHFAQFAGGLSVNECVFEQEIMADGANFGPFARFCKCHFIGSTFFSNTKFETVDLDQAKFKDICAFDNAKFAGRAFFTDSIFTNSANFKNVEFHDVTSFDLAEASSAAVPISFKDAKFCKHPPRFFGRALHENTDWTSVTLPNAKAQAALSQASLEDDKCADDTDLITWEPLDPQSLLEDDKRAYEQLRIKCGALGKVEDEHMFFRKEMELTGHLSPWYTRATYWLYHLVSDYGHSYWRPIAGMVGVWYFWSLFYALHSMARDQLHLCMDRLELLPSIAGLSFANIFAVFGFYRRFPSDLLADPTFVTVLLTVSETLLGFVFLFFLGLGLRTRFRLR